MSLTLLGQLPAGLVVGGKYRLQKSLGAGGFATVYKAERVEDGSQVAIKVLNPPQHDEARDGGTKNRVTQERFLREAQVTEKLSHPNVVKVYDYGFLDEKARPYIVMELLEGVTLETELRERGAMLPARAMALALQCLDALQEGHQQGIVHRDLKPANLFLVRAHQPDEAICLLDYGIAGFAIEEAERLTSTGQLVGTYQYLSPEYIKNKVISPALDVYQMGLILVEMLTGTPVVNVSNHFAIFSMHVEGRLELPRALLDSPLGPIVSRALHVDHTQRYPDAHAFYEALETVVVQDIPVLDDTATRQFVMSPEATAAISAAPTAVASDAVSPRVSERPAPEATSEIATPNARTSSPAKPSNLARVFVIGGIVVGLVALGAAGSMMIDSSTSPRTTASNHTTTNAAKIELPAATASEIKIVIKAEPTDALIRHNDRILGRGDAVVKFRAADTNPKKVTVEHPGFEPQELTLSPKENTSVVVKLQPKTAQQPPGPKDVGASPKSGLENRPTEKTNRPPDHKPKRTSKPIKNTPKKDTGVIVLPE